MAAGPNALRGSGPNPSHAFEDAMTQAGSPDPRNDRVCITSLCPRQFLVTSAFRQLRRRQQLRLLESLAAHHHGPRHACDFVSKCNGSDLDRPTPHQTSEPRPFCAVLACISDDGHGAGHEQPAQMSIALFRDAAQSLFAAGRMLSRHQADPCSKTAAGRERLPISDLGHQRGSDNWTNARDFLQPSAFFARAVPSVDTLLDATISDLIVAYWRARTARLNRAAAGIRSSCSSAIISSSFAVPLRPFAEIMPSSAMCPRMAFDRIVR